MGVFTGGMICRTPLLLHGGSKAAPHRYETPSDRLITRGGKPKEAGETPKQIPTSCLTVSHFFFLLPQHNESISIQKMCGNYEPTAVSRSIDAISHQLQRRNHAQVRALSGAPNARWPVHQRQPAHVVPVFCLLRGPRSATAAAALFFVEGASEPKNKTSKTKKGVEYVWGG